MGWRISHILATVLTVVLGSSSAFAVPKQDKLQDFDYWASLCNSLLKSRKYKEAIEACDQAIIQNATEPLAWLDRGDALAGMERFTEAVVSYDRFLRLRANSSEVLTKRCFALNELARYDEAIASCEQALRIDQNWQDISPAEAWYYQASILKRWNRLVWSSHSQ